VLYIFGVFLLYAAAKMALGKMGEVDPSRSRLLVFLKKRFRFTDVYDGDRFFVKKDGVLWATPLMLVIVLVESSDVMFAVDSIPAIFAITTDAVVVFTSNMFAILGLRSLFFLLAGVMDKFVYLDKGLAVILGFVGLKILLASFVHIPIWASLSVVAVVLAITIAASLLRSEESAGRQGS
jgi:tellurite resistance protein TerC